MDKVVAKLALLSLVLTLAFAITVKCNEGPVKSTVQVEEQSTNAVVESVPAPQIDTQNTLPDAGVVSTDASTEAAPCVTCGRSTVDTGKQVRQYGHSRKLVWMCTEPRESMLGTMYRDCRDVIVVK